MRIRLSDESYVPRLESSFLAAGCLAHEVDPVTIRVVHPYALDTTEAALELQFFLRAWQLQHPQVVAEIVP